MDDDILIPSLSALGQTTRLAIYRVVSAAGASGMQTGSIAERVGMPANYISKHLQILVEVGLFTRHVRGRTATYAVDRSAAASIAAMTTAILAPEDASDT